MKFKIFTSYASPNSLSVQYDKWAKENMDVTSGVANTMYQAVFDRVEGQMEYSICVFYQPRTLVTPSPKEEAVEETVEEVEKEVEETGQLQNGEGEVVQNNIPPHLRSQKDDKDN